MSQSWTGRVTELCFQVKEVAWSYPFIQAELAVQGGAGGHFRLQNQVSLLVHATGVNATAILLSAVHLETDPKTESEWMFAVGGRGWGM